MATEAKLRQLADSGCPVYYFYSSERYLVRQAVAAAVRVLSADSGEEATVLVPKHLFFWVREYNAALINPYKHKTEFMYNDDGTLDLDATGSKALEANCKYVVISGTAASTGSLEDYGYVPACDIPGDNCVYTIYRLSAG